MNDFYHMPMSAVVAAQFAGTERDVRDCEELYRRGTRIHSFWAMTDLRSSAGYRLLAGDAAAYVRVEIFTRTVRRLYGRYDGVEVLKEIGDAVLIRSNDLRPLLEVACVYAALSKLWGTHRERSLDISLDTRTAITFGAATRLYREGVSDYVGRPLDRLARIASEDQPSEVVCLVEDDALAQDRDVVGREYPFLSSDGPYTMSSGKMKPGENPIRYWQIHLDRAEFSKFRDYFQALREVR